jgi:SAM-dependent methyltransferase
MAHSLLSFGRREAPQRHDAFATRWLRSLIAVPLRDLGEQDAAYHGILAPHEHLDRVAGGVTSQFLEDADAYHGRYFNTDYWSSLITTALRRAAGEGARSLDVHSILDVGSGSGNTVFPLIKLFPDARIAACDISAPLLRLLGHALREQGHAQAVGLACLDLNRKWFKPGTFDLAIGGAILHHLFDPAVLIEEVFRAVRPGGAAIYFEPFEIGHKLLALIYRQILDAAPSRGGLSERPTQFLQNRIDEFALRTGTSKPAETYARVDDKWLFTRSFFEGVAKQIGAKELITYPLHGSEDVFVPKIRFELQCGAGLEPDALPPWAWDIAARTQAMFSAEVRDEIPVEGCVMFRQ